MKPLHQQKEKRKEKLGVELVGNKTQLSVEGRVIDIGVEMRNGEPVFTIRAQHGYLIILPDSVNQIGVLVSL